MVRDHMALSEVDGDRVRAEREARRWTQPELATECNKLAAKDFNSVTVSPKTVWRVEKGVGNARRRTVETILAALSLRLEDVLRPRGIQSPAVSLDYARFEAINQVFRIAIAYAMMKVREIIQRPYLAGTVRTSGTKITDRLSDPTEAIDQIASEAIDHVLRAAFQDKSHPLSEGFVLFDEERGYVGTYAPSDGSLAQLVIFVDPVDDTRQGRRGIGGTCLLSAYHRSLGWCVACIGDLVRNALYFRVADHPSQALILSDPPATGRTISEPPFAFRDPAGWPIRGRSAALSRAARR